MRQLRWWSLASVMSSTQESVERRLNFPPAGRENRFDDGMIDTGESFL